MTPKRHDQMLSASLHLSMHPLNAFGISVIRRVMLPYHSSPHETPVCVDKIDPDDGTVRKIHQEQEEDRKSRKYESTQGKRHSPHNVCRMYHSAPLAFAVLCFFRTGRPSVLSSSALDEADE
jgi:hypothetical protein